MTRSQSVLDAFCIAAIWAACALLANPAGDFPLNDDWSFGQTAKTLAQTGDFRPHGWTSMPLLTNATWGALFCKLLGLSFASLRLSTLVLAGIGLLFNFATLIRLGVPRPARIIATLTLGFSPVYFPLSYTFMTDVPFTAILSAAGYYYVVALQDGRARALVTATVLSILAVLSRQLGLALPLGFLVSQVVQPRAGLRSWLTSAVPFAASLTAYLAFNLWLDVSGRTPATYSVKTESLVGHIANPASLLRAIAQAALWSLLYVGLFALPALPALLGRPSRALCIRLLSLSAISLLLIVPLVLLLDTRLPRLGNILLPSGIGPLTLRDTAVLEIPNIPAWPAPIWLAVNLFAVAGAALLLACLLFGLGRIASGRQPARSDIHSRTFLFFLGSAIVYVLVIAGSGTLFDRYFLPVTAWVLLSTAAIMAGLQTEEARPANSRGQIVSVLVLGGAAIVSVGATRDYLEWNRARWDAVAFARSSLGIEPTRIDGGFEFNGFYLYDADYQSDEEKSPWWVEDDEYLVSFGPVPGYEIVRQFPYTNWVPFEARDVTLLRRSSDPSAVTK